ncbi:DUF695 domain-containing protein [Lysobacter sp. 1R34A]|uniref:DUF695 domain-containing protein n=1 Tax=Lysobacter sp. 1R34A TaxID=3445786 RepID=UPI003EEF6CC5
MSDDWDFYFCNIDDEPASIFVDLGLAKEAPIAGLTLAAALRVQMRQPREDGLSSQEEFRALMEIEDALQAALNDEGTLYIGRCTYAGVREFHFRLDDAGDWERRTTDAMRPFQDYAYTTAVRSDPEWDSYFRFLYPSDEERERMTNRRVCDSLEEHGDPLTQARPIDHWVYFEDIDARSAFVARTADMGVTVAELLEPDEDRQAYGVRLVGDGIPARDRIDDITLPLYRAARDHGGNYDGWECMICKP